MGRVLEKRQALFLEGPTPAAEITVEPPSPKFSTTARDNSTDEECDEDDASTPTWWSNDVTGRRFVMPDVPDAVTASRPPTAKIKVTPPPPPAPSADDSARLRVSTFLPPRRHSWMSG